MANTIFAAAICEKIAIRVFFSPDELKFYLISKRHKRLVSEVSNSSDNSLFRESWTFLAYQKHIFYSSIWSNSWFTPVLLLWA